MATGIMHTRRKADCRAGAGDRSTRMERSPIRDRSSGAHAFPKLRGACHRAALRVDPLAPSGRLGSRCPTGKTPERASSRARENIPLYRNSELAYVSPIPAHQEGRSCVVTVASRACGGRDSVGRERLRAGRIALREPKTSCRMSGAVRFVSSVSFRLRRQGWKNCGEMAGRAYGKTVWSFPQALFSAG